MVAFVCGSVLGNGFRIWSIFGIPGTSALDSGVIQTCDFFSYLSSCNGGKPHPHYIPAAVSPPRPPTSRHCRAARVYDHTTTAMHEIECISPIDYTPPLRRVFPFFHVNSVRKIENVSQLSGRLEPLVLALTGSTGTGKTETAWVLAEGLLAKRCRISGGTTDIPRGLLVLK